MTVITASTFLERVGEPNERPEDRRIAHAMLVWGFRQEHRRALAEDDYDALDHLDKWWRQLDAL